MRLMKIKMLDKLYHPIYSFYRGKPYDFSTLENQEIFLSYADTFNDKFEGSVFVDCKEFEEQYLHNFVGDCYFQELSSKFKFCKDISILDEIFIHTDVNGLSIPNDMSMGIKELLIHTDWKKFKNRLEKTYQKYLCEIDKVRKSFGIKCFTVIPPETNSIMWAYYGNNYKGFCCNFSLGKIVYDLPSSRCDEYGKFIYEHFEKVKYKDNFAPSIKIDCFKLLEIPIDKIKCSPYILDAVKKSLAIKQSQWKHEKEIRLIIKDDENIEIAERTKHGFKIRFPYLSEISYCCKKSHPFLSEEKGESKKHEHVKILAKRLNLICKRLTPSREKKIFNVEQVFPYPPKGIAYDYSPDDELPF